MAAGSDYFNGVSVLFSSATIGKLKGIKYSRKGKDIELTSNDDSEHIGTVGKPKTELTLSIVGPPVTLGVGSAGSLTVTWPDATTHGTITKAAVTSVDKNGQLDGEVSSDIAFINSI
jgi:hypothetical protein